VGLPREVATHKQKKKKKKKGEGSSFGVERQEGGLKGARADSKTNSEKKNNPSGPKKKAGRNSRKGHGLKKPKKNQNAVTSRKKKAWNSDGDLIRPEGGE